MVEELEEFLDTGFNRGELNLIQAKICTVGKFHGPYHQNNGQNIVPNNAQNNGQNNPQNIAPNNAPFEIHHVEDVNVAHNIVPNFQPNAQNYVTRDEFAGFKESINCRFDRLERSIQALGGRNLNNEERKRKKEKKKKMR